MAFAIGAACGGSGDDTGVDPCTTCADGAVGGAIDGGTTGDGSDAMSEPDAAPPASTAPQPLTATDSFYPRAIELADGAILASVVAPQTGHLGGTILESTDGGLSFAVVGHIDDDLANGGLCCATLYQLPRALGALPAGALLWSASVGGDTAGAPMSIPVWSSVDRGRTWSRLSTVVVGAVNRSQGGLWEPEFVQLDDGTLVCHYSDETDGGHSQKLVEARTTDGVTWTSHTNTVAMSSYGARPGMPVVRRLPSGTYVMSYEICGTDGCSAHLRTSTDGWSWGDPDAAGPRPATVDGSHLRHAPNLAWAGAPGRGRFYLIGQQVFNGGGGVSGDNGVVILANTEDGNGNWYAVPAPIPIPEAYDNFCPNYSSSLLSLENGRVVLELASKWDNGACRTFFARGPLLGSGDAAGVDSGATYRLISVQSNLCLDVAGGSTAANANIQQWSCNGLAPQAWTVTLDGSGAATLTSQVSGMCLAADGVADGAGVNVTQKPCDGSAAQAWSVENVGAGYYRLRRPGGGPCLDVAGGSQAAGGNVQQWTCNDLQPQIWRFVRD